jgi:hypothetical protein
MLVWRRVLQAIIKMTWIMFCFLYALQQLFLGEELDQFKPSYVVQGVTAGALCFEVRIFSR